MNKPRQTWILFGLSLVVVLIALGRVTFAALHLDDTQRRADELAGMEERVRLALWRMDSALALLVAEEDARTVESFEAFYAVRPAASLTQGGNTGGEVRLPSPLLGFASSNIWLHFQFGPDGRLASPQVPSQSESRLAEAAGVSMGGLVEAGQRLAELQRQLDERASVPSSPRDSSGGGGLFSSRVPPEKPSDGRRASLNRDLVVEDATVGLNAPPPGEVPRTPVTAQNTGKRSKTEIPTQGIVADNELQARYNTFNNQLGNQRGNQRQEFQVLTQSRANGQATGEDTGQVLQVGRLTATWVGSELLLTRRVNIVGSYRVQGCWLNWPVLRESLLASIRDLLPQPDLRVATDNETGDPTRRLVALRGATLELLPGLIESVPLPLWSPVRITLVLAWVAVVCAALAVALLLNGAVSLSERRAAFVSAVTHELRTPLTTFKMYSEMLAGEMVTDPVQRRRYLETLCSEADRLGHLVENVLAFARLERGSARSRVERTTLGELLERILPRLVQRAELAGTRLLATVPPEHAAVVVHVEATAVEQILFNLVDNACKHGTGARVGAAPIELEVMPATRGEGVIRVRDHGPGISAEIASRLFEPFCRSADEAARSTPGVGLGLALCRRLVRGMGGDLKWDASVTDGTCFELSLPRSARGPGATLA